MRQTLLLIPVLMLLLIPTFTYGKELNAGFVEGLWYSKQNIFANEPVRIYAALRNNTEYDLTGVVTFRVDGSIVGRKDVSALPGRLVEAWADWAPTYGEHEVKAELVNIRLHTVGEPPEVADVTSTLAEDLIFVDHDSDGDGVGNEEDTDDDNDGVSDREEAANGTDPLDPDDPPADQVENTADSTGSYRDTDGANDTTSNGDPQGLERFLTESRAENALSSVTNTINDAKRTLDEYRTTRNTATDETSTDETPGTDETTTGTSAGTTSEGQATITRTHIDTPPSGFAGFLKGLVSFLGALLDGGYTLALFLLSLYLAHPAFVQLTLLMLILFLVYKLAKRMGQRPN